LGEIWFTFGDMRTFSVVVNCFLAETSGSDKSTRTSMMQASDI